MSQQDEISRAEKAGWLEMRPGKDMRGELQARLGQARGALELACERSTDPAVRAAYERVRGLDDVFRLFTE